MPINGHTSSSHTLFAPRRNGHLTVHRISDTASSPPSAVRPGGLRATHRVSNGVSSLPDGSSVDGERPRGGGWQDKAVLTDGLPAVPQPGPDTIGARSSVLDSGSPRSQNHSDAKERLVKGAVWMRPGVKAAIASLAEQNGLSFSATAAKGLEIYARAKIQDQQEELFEPKMRLMMRGEIRASDKRHIYFEMRNAIAAEQTRILITDLYKRQLQKEGMPLKKINEKLDNTYTMARTNILRKTKSPQLRNLLEEWWRTTEEENSGEGEAGTGNSHV